MKRYVSISMEIGVILLLQTLFLTIFLFLYILTCVVVAEKRKDKPCNHAESMNFLCQDNLSYFTTTYINGNKSWPRSCFQCSIELEVTTK